LIFSGVLMNLSEFADYDTAVTASVAGDLSEARDAYERLLEHAESIDDDVAISYIMQSLANIEARDGNLNLGHELHQRAIGQFSGVPLLLILYAKGLAKYFDSPELAQQKLDDAERMIESKNWNQQADKITRESYERQIADVRREIGG
jgi:predicted Zn-dependent protease